MKKLFVFIIRGLKSSGYNVEMIELKDFIVRFKVNLHNTDEFVYIEVKHDKVFKMRLFKGMYLDKTLGAKGSKTIFEAKDSMDLTKKLESFLTKPENNYHRVKVHHKSTEIYHAVGLRAGKRVYNVALTDKELEKYQDYVVNPAELGKINTISRSGKSYQTKYKPQTIKVRGGSNKAARASMYGSIVYPKSRL